MQSHLRSTMFRQLCLVLALRLASVAAQTSPVQKVVQLLSDLETKVIKEGEDAKKTYGDFSAWCKDQSKNLQYNVKTAKAEIEELRATIDESTSSATSMSAKIDDTAATLASNEADLKAATDIREREAADFKKEEKEMMEVVDMLERAVLILEREMRKGDSAALAQVQKAGSLAEAFRVMVQASMLRSQDAQKLTALVQQKNAAAEDDDDSDMPAGLGAPDAAVYESHSGNIVETLEGLLDEAKEMLGEARKKEMSAKNNFEVLKQSLTDEIKYGGQDLDKAKKGLAQAQETKAVAEGDLSVTSKTLADDEKTLSTMGQDCMTRAQEFEETTKSREEELKALAEAKKAITENTGAAGDLTYASASFLQTDSDQGTASSIRTSTDLAHFEAVRFVRDLARKQHSEALAQLARRMAVAERYDATAGDDPFAKVRGLITDMIANLEKDASDDASHKAYCDKELGETVSKKEDKEASISKLTAKIDTMSAKSTQLKEEVAALQKALAELAQSQSEMMQIRQEEKAQYNKNKPEMEAGLEGVKMALRILNEYYAKEGDAAHETAEGSASGIIGMLEVVESDFSKTMAEMSAVEANAEAEYERISQENEITKSTKEADVKYKTKEYKSLDAALAEATSDREGVQTELSAILEYNGKLMQMCTAKPETYEERKSRREAEIAGLKEALSILEGESMLLQRTKALRRLRGGQTQHMHLAAATA